MRRIPSLFVVLLAGCSGPSLVVVGEGVPPAPPTPELEVLVLSQEGDPVVDAQVEFDGFDTETTGSNGRVTSEWPRQAITISASADGFHPASLQVLDLPDPRIVELSLDPVVLTGSVATEDGHGLPGAKVTLGDQTTMTGVDGQFELVQVVAGPVAVSKAAYESVTMEWDGATESVATSMVPLRIRSVRASGPAAGDPEIWQGLLDLVDETEVNAVVIDTKDESGFVFHNTSVATAADIGAIRSHYDPSELLADLDERGIYAITRIVTFQDFYLGSAFPSLAVRDSASGEPWTTAGGQVWIDPTDRDSWEYPLALAEEACALGFDEIQFDYVRFPTDGPVARAVFDGPADVTGRIAAISTFLTEARTRLNPAGCAVAADVFAVVLSVDGDQGLGQRVEEIAESVDVLSPMIYPSHYSTGWFGYECPNDFPGQVVAGALDDGLPRIEGPVVVRPWIQDFTFGCGKSYGPDEVRSQIEAAEERGLGWILWNARSNFTELALDVEDE